MKEILKRWGALGGTAVLCTALGSCLTDFGYHLKQAVIDTLQDGRLTAAETWQKRHEDESKQPIAELHKVSRQMDALLVWLATVANREGWLPPPQPARFKETVPGRGIPWVSEAQAEPLCTEECP